MKKPDFKFSAKTSMKRKLLFTIKIIFRYIWPLQTENIFGPDFWIFFNEFFFQSSRVAQKVKNQQYVKARLRFLATIVILSFSANIGAQIIYLGTLSGLSDIELGVEGKKMQGIIVKKIHCKTLIVLNCKKNPFKTLIVFNCKKNPLQNIDCI